MEVPGLKKWVILPLFIDVIFMFVGVLWCSHFIQSTVTKATLMIFGETGGGWGALTYYLLLALLWFVFIVLFFYFVWLAASIIAAPFYAIMAERTLRHLGALEAKTPSLTLTLKTSLKMIWISFVRGIILLIVGAFLFVSSFIPGLNLLAGFALFIILALDSMDYAFEARAMGLSERWRFFLRNLPEFLGMGAFVGLTSFVPGLILLVMPVAVVGSAGLMGKIVTTQIAEKK